MRDFRYRRNRFYSALYDLLELVWITFQWVIIFGLIGLLMLWAIPGYLRWAIWG